MKNIDRQWVIGEKVSKGSKETWTLKILKIFYHFLLQEKDRGQILNTALKSRDSAEFPSFMPTQINVPKHNKMEGLSPLL